MTSLPKILRRWFRAPGEVVERAPRAPEWPALPPLETVAGAIDLVGESRSFANGLAGATRLGVAGRALAHGAGLDAPRGKVAGVPVRARRRPDRPASSRRRGRTPERPASTRVWQEAAEPDTAMGVIETAREDASQLEKSRLPGRSAPSEPHASEARAAGPRATKRIRVKVRRPASPRGTSRRAGHPAHVPTPVERALPVVPGKTSIPVATGLRPAPGKTSVPVAPGLRPTPQALHAVDPSPAAPPAHVPVPRRHQVAPPRSRPLIGSPERAPVGTEKPPAAVRAAVERAFGVDLGHVPVHRRERSAAVAEKIGAQAFAVRDQVHVPARHGGLESERAAPLLAHELAHVAQHERTRRGEPARPETTLEHEARSVEESWRSTDSSRATSIHAPASIPRLPELAPHPRGAPPAPPPAAVRAPAFAPSAETPRPDPIRRAAGAFGGDVPDAAPLPIDELVRHLYERIRSRLRAELLVDRERAGTLTDLRVR